ncbi:glutathione S-transferase family protein [Marinicauda salina]|uniref:Glutathione S-transferase family protein n=1 Tax=Marinicauda salina TaxID=2135793 RepID=A0A2U2BY41_9PROT|nr:glutathione S-transferase family protein [Marinicauda salina]PWE18926.1 glutathione S-transferase family protein [Marinicauda salina]
MTDARFTLYHAPRSRSIRPRWALEEMGLDYRLERVAFTHGDVGGPSYREVNPLQKIPAFMDGDAVILESVAILEYLVNKYGPTPLAVLPDEPEYPRYLEWLHFGEGTMTTPVNMLLGHTWLLPEEHRIEAMARWGRREADRHLNMISERGLKHSDYLAGDRFTAADISVGYMLFLLKLLRVLDDAPGPVQAYWKRITAREAWIKASAD